MKGSVLGCPSLLKGRNMSRLIKDPIYLDIIIGNLKGQNFPTSSSIRIFTLKFTKEILKIQRKNQETGYFHFFTLKQLFGKI